jgi:hypothetical protein
MIPARVTVLFFNFIVYDSICQEDAIGVYETQKMSGSPSNVPVNMPFKRG